MRVILKWLGRIGFAAVVVLFAAGWVAGAWLVKPERKGVEDFHRAWLGELDAHGLKVDLGRAESGVPFLVCEPEDRFGPGKRGRILREQLVERGVELEEFGNVVGTVVLLHGRGGRKEDLLLTAERFCAVGLRCVIPDLPGHGENPAAAVGFGGGELEGGLAEEALRSAAGEFGFAARPAGLWGMSMGGAYAIRAAATDPGWSALVVVSTYANLEGVVFPALRSRVGVAAPVVRVGMEFGARMGGLAVGEVMPVVWAQTLRLPVLVIHGTEDELIPVEQGREIFGAIPAERKELMVVATGRHGNVLVTPDLVYARMAAWILGSMREVGH